MNTAIRLCLTIGLLTVGAATSFGQHPAMPAGMTHAEHQAQMKKDAELKQRGAGAMGFDQDAATHHFLLDRTGGTIEVTARDPSDEKTRAAIRSHLTQIAVEFTLGKFDKPIATHDELPPGARAMQARRKAIAYQYEEMPSGGRVRISSNDGKAIAAVQEFLRYQIREHRSGDRLSVSATSPARPR